MKFKRLTLEKPRPVNCKKLDPKNKSGRVFQQAVLKSVTGSQESRISNSPSQAVTRSVSESVTGSASKSDDGSASELVSVSVTGSAIGAATKLVKDCKLNLHQN